MPPVRNIREMLRRSLLGGKIRYASLEFQSARSHLFPDQALIEDFLTCSDHDQASLWAHQILLSLRFRELSAASTLLLQNLRSFERDHLTATHKSETDKGDYVPRDHFVHLVHLYLLGIHLFGNHRIFYERISEHLHDHMRDVGLSRTPLKQNVYILFQNFWLPFVLSHDLGYPAEQLPPEKRTPESTAYRRYLEAFDHPVEIAFKDIYLCFMGRLAEVYAVLQEPSGSELSAFVRDSQALPLVFSILPARVAQQHLIYSRRLDYNDRGIPHLHPPEVRPPSSQLPEGSDTEQHFNAFTNKFGAKAESLFTLHEAQLVSGVEMARNIRSFVDNDDIWAVLIKDNERKPKILVGTLDGRIVSIHFDIPAKGRRTERLGEETEAHFRSAFGKGGKSRPFHRWIYFIPKEKQGTSDITAQLLDRLFAGEADEKKKDEHKEACRQLLTEALGEKRVQDHISMVRPGISALCFRHFESWIDHVTPWQVKGQRDLFFTESVTEELLRRFDEGVKSGPDLLCDALKSYFEDRDKDGGRLRNAMSEARSSAAMNMSAAERGAEFLFGEISEGRKHLEKQLADMMSHTLRPAQKIRQIAEKHFKYWREIFLKTAKDGALDANANTAARHFNFKIPDSTPICRPLSKIIASSGERRYANTDGDPSLYRWLEENQRPVPGYEKFIGNAFEPIATGSFVSLREIVSAYCPSWIKENDRKTYFDHGFVGYILYRQASELQVSLLGFLAKDSEKWRGEIPEDTTNSLRYRQGLELVIQGGMGCVDEFEAASEMVKLLSRDNVVDAAIFLHNAYPKQFNRIKTQKKQQPQLKKGKIRLRDSPFAYFSMVADALQKWDRRALVKQLALGMKIGLAGDSFNIDIEDGDPPKIRLTARGGKHDISEAYASPQELDQYLEPGANLFLVSLDQTK